MKWKGNFPIINPMLMDLVLLLSVSIIMSIVFITAAYRVYIQFTGL